MSGMQRGAGVLLIDERGWILLQLRDANGAYPHRWGTVGGKVESGETVASRVAAQRWFAPDQPIITSPCGFNHLPREIAVGKLMAIAAAKRILSAGDA